MASHKKYDVIVKIGSYESNGENKSRWQNVGVILENDDGGRFMLLNRTFCPAGCPNPDNRETVMLSFVEPKQKEQQQSTTQEEE